MHKCGPSPPTYSHTTFYPQEEKAPEKASHRDKAEPVDIDRLLPEETRKNKKLFLSFSVRGSRFDLCKVKILMRWSGASTCKTKIKNRRFCLGKNQIISTLVVGTRAEPSVPPSAPTVHLPPLTAASRVAARRVFCFRAAGSRCFLV